MAYQKVKLDETSSKDVLVGAQEYDASHPTGDGNNTIPISFMSSAGSYTIRIFPDIFKGKTRIARHTFLHFLNFKSPSTNKDMKLRVVNDTRLSKLLEAFTDSDLSNEKFKFDAKEYSLLLARVYEAPAEDDYMSKSIKNSTGGFVDTILVVKPKVMKAINGIIGDLTPSQAVEFLDIDTKTFGLRIDLVRETSSTNDKISWLEPKVSVTKGQYDLGLPLFPEGAEWDGLDKAYIPEDQVISEMELSALTIYLNRLKERNANYIDREVAKDGFSKGDTSREPSWNTDMSSMSQALDDDIPF